MSIETCVRLLRAFAELLAVEGGHVCWCISKHSNKVNVTLLNVTRICCCLCKVLENKNRTKTGEKTFQQVHAILGLSVTFVPAPMTLALSSSSSMILCKPCVPGKDIHCCHYGARTREDCLHIFLYIVLYEMQGAHARRTRCFDALLPVWYQASGMGQLPLHGCLAAALA